MPKIVRNFEVRNVPGKGRGVFATSRLKQGEIIEESPVIVIPSREEKHLEKTELYNYYFAWKKKDIAVALGYGSLFNHSYSPNAKYDFKYGKKLIIVKALREINAGEEITFNYNWNPKDKSPIWFKPKK